jgi:hypothetical protein
VLTLAASEAHHRSSARARRFTPCEWTDLACHALVDIAAASRTALPGIVGHHKNAGTWLKGYEAAASPLPLTRRLRSAGALPYVVAGATAAVLVILAAALRRRRRGSWAASGVSGALGMHGGALHGTGGGGARAVRLLWGSSAKEARLSGVTAARRALPPPVSAAAVAAASVSWPAGSGSARFGTSALPRPGSAGQLP